MPLAPILLFAFKRYEHTKATLDALRKNYLADQSELVVVLDGARNELEFKEVQKVKELVLSEQWCGKVELIARKENRGLNENFFDTIAEVLAKHNKIIVLEDDICAAPYFLKYMNDALDHYENEKKVMNISGFAFNWKTKSLPESFFIKCSSTWGWATWKDRWDLLIRNPKIIYDEVQRSNLKFDFTQRDTENDYFEQLEVEIEGKKNIWDIKWYGTLMLNDGLSLYPRKSLVENIGFDGSGTHYTANVVGHKIELEYDKINDFPSLIEENVEARKAIGAYFKSLHPTFFDKAKYKLNLLKSKYFGK